MVVSLGGGEWAVNARSIKKCISLIEGVQSALTPMGDGAERLVLTLTLVRSATATSGWFA